MRLHYAVPLCRPCRCSSLAHPTLLHAFLTLIVLASTRAQLKSRLLPFNHRPLRICTASVDNFGVRCHGAPAELEDPDAVEPGGHDDVAKRCPGGRRFCGHDIDAWSEVASRLGLVENRDFEHVCLGELGFEYMMSSLAGQNATYGICDIGVSAITVSSDREELGITFSRAIHRSFLAVMVHAPMRLRGKWTFFDPLHQHVWLALVATVFGTPLIVFFFESVFNKRTFYAEDGRLHVLRGLRECMWHSVCHALSIDVFRVRSFSARIVTVAYAFLVLIITHTYTANLAAFLTVQQLDTPIRSIKDLQGKAVSTVEVYASRLAENHHISASVVDCYNYESMITKLQRGEYKAVIADDTQLLPRAYLDPACSLHILQDQVEPFDLAFAFRRGFANTTLRAAVSSAVLEMQEDGSLSAIKEGYTPEPPECLSQPTMFVETTQVGVSSVWGLWIILAVAIGMAAASATVEYAIKRRMKHADVAVMHDRLITLASGSSRYDPDDQRAQAAKHAACEVCEGCSCGRPAVATPFLAVPSAHRGRPASKPGRHFLRPGSMPGGGLPGASMAPDYQPPQAPAAQPPHAPAPQRDTTQRSGPADLLHRSSITEHYDLEADEGAGLPPSLSVHSRPANPAADTDSTSPEGSAHGLEATLMLPQPPLSLRYPEEVALQHAQRAQRTSEDEAAVLPSATAQAGELRSEMADVVSMLRMLTERVVEMQRSQRVHV